MTPEPQLGPYRRADYEQLPDHPRQELLYGSFLMSPSPSVSHQLIVGLIWMRFHLIAQRTGGLALMAPLDVGLAEHSIVQPDVLYMTAERREIRADRLRGAPDLLVEVLSPGTAHHDRGAKMRLYAESGVREYWLVSPLQQRIEFLVHRDGAFAMTRPDGEFYRSPELPEIQVDLAELWRELDASAS